MAATPGLEKYTNDRVNVGDFARETLSKVGGAKYDHSQRGRNLRESLASANVSLHPAEWLVLCAGFAIVTAGLAAVASQSVFTTIVVSAATIGLAQLWLVRKIRRRKTAFDKQLGPAIQAISNGVKAGYTFVQALALVGSKTPHPLGLELLRVARATQLGMPLHDALEQMIIRNPSDDLRLLMTAVHIQQQVGGNLARILDTIEFTIRERVRVRDQIQTLTGQARASGWVLTVLPIALAIIIELISPAYISPMFSRVPGQIMLAGAGFSLICGYGIIRKIVNVKIRCSP